MGKIRYETPDGWCEVNAAPSSVCFTDSKPPRMPLGGNSARKARNRKQVAPLDFRKFLPEYSENQKWAAHNMLRPSSVNSVDSFPPRGSHEVADNFCRRKFYSLKFSAGKGKPVSKAIFFKIYIIGGNPLRNTRWVSYILSSLRA